MFSSKPVEYLPQLPTQHSENPLLPSLRYKHYVVFEPLFI